MYSHFGVTSWVTPYGLAFLAAIMLTWWLARRNARSVAIDPSHIDLLIPLAISAGVVGGTLIALLLSGDDGIRVKLFAVVGIGAATLVVYSHFAKLPSRRLLDVFAVPVIAALMVHRVGCYLAGCCWGDVVSYDIVRGVQYPPGSFAYEQHLDAGLIEPGALSSLPVHAVQLYEAGVLLVVLLLLWRVPWRRYAAGSITVLTVCTYALVRFLIEYLRADSALVLGNLTVTQLQCIVLMFSVVLLPLSRKAD